MLKLLVCKALLHTDADELLGMLRYAVEDALKTHQRAYQVLVEARLGRVDLIDRVDQTALLREVGQF